MRFPVIPVPVLLEPSDVIVEDLTFMCPMAMPSRRAGLGCKLPPPGDAAADLEIAAGALPACEAA